MLGFCDEKNRDQVSFVQNRVELQFERRTNRIHLRVILNVLSRRVVVGIASDVLAVRWLIDSNVLDLHHRWPYLVEPFVVYGSEVLRNSEVDEKVLRERTEEKVSVGGPKKRDGDELNSPSVLQELSSSRLPK